jgi:hypothetical protein
MCPTCDRNFMGPRDMNLTKLPLWKMVHCGNNAKGCRVILPRTLIVDHKETCPYKHISCPLKTIPEKYCKWEGLLKHVKRHVKKKHKTLIKGQQFISFSRGSRFNIVIPESKDEVFIFYRQHRNGKCFGTLQRVGLSRRFYTCQIIFDSPRDIDTIIFTFVVPNMRKSFRYLLESGSCFMMNDNVLDPFYWENGLEISVNINTDVRNHIS